ncbi:MAG: hypothetical protein CMN78_01465 [Spirochaetales bacterium]|nr:hypothetical protein [Spirochaetales bacterium]
MNIMTPKERLIAALNNQPVDKVPFWPKSAQDYVNYQTNGKYNDWSLRDYHEYFDSDLWQTCAENTKLAPSCVSQYDETPEAGNRDRVVIRHIIGSDERKSVRIKGHPVEFSIKNLNDIIFMTAWFQGTRYETDEVNLEKQKQQLQKLGDRGILAHRLGKSPLMLFIEILAGVENAHYFLHDFPDEIDVLFEAMHQDILRRTKVALKSSVADLFFMGENTSTTLISPAQYRKYTKKHIADYKQVCSEHGKLMALHMCGFLKGVLADLADLEIQSFEAFTTPPVGNTHLLDGRLTNPNTCIIGGTNAALWLQPAKDICQAIKEELDALPHHRGIVVSSAGVMPPACNPETIKRVADFVHAYPARF